MLDVVPLYHHLLFIVLDDLETSILISLSQLCYDDRMALFTKHDVKIAKQNKDIIMGQMWAKWPMVIPISPMPVQQANGILCSTRPKNNWQKITMYLSWQPAKSTLLQAICCRLYNFPRINYQTHIQTSFTHIATKLGHQDHEAKHLRSTKLYRP